MSEERWYSATGLVSPVAAESSTHRCPEQFRKDWQPAALRYYAICRLGRVYGLGMIIPVLAR
jgi:hypothetical protein